MIHLREGLDAMDFDRVQSWLAKTYWVPGVTREAVIHAAKNSAVVIGAFNEAGVQVGYARAVSDKFRFAWICDVIVEESHRGQGIGRMMVSHLMNHSELQTVKIWTLGTRDAHGVYAALGFKPITDPSSHSERWMVRLVE